MFTVCTAHGFSSDIAARNIMQLLGYYEYVDIIMIGNNSSSPYTDFVVAAKFSLFNSDDLELTTVTNILTNLGTIDTNSYAQYAHAIGSTSTAAGGEVEVLYNNSSYEDSAILSYVAIGSARHHGAYFSLYYIQEYINTIKTNYSGKDFSDVVASIYNSFDGSEVTYWTVSPTYTTGHSLLFQNLKNLTGFDISSSTSLTSDLSSSSVKEAVETIVEYDSDGKYIVLIPTASNMNNITNSWLSGRLTETEVKNNLLYTMFLINPSGTYGTDNEASVRSTIDAWLTSGHTWDYENDFGDDVYNYNQTLTSSSIIEGPTSYAKTITITTTIDPAFDVTKSDVSVTSASNDNKFITYDIDVGEKTSSGTKVTITITNNDVYEYTCDVKISIEITIADNVTSFYDTSTTYGFKDTNTVNTQAAITKQATYSISGTQASITENTVSVASTALHLETFTLTYNANNDDTNPSTSVDTNLYISSSNPTLVSISDAFSNTTIDTGDDGVVFIGWTQEPNIYTKDDPVKDSTTASNINTVDSVTFSNANITVYAVWAIDSDNNGIADYREFTIEYYANDGSSSPYDTEANILVDQAHSLISVADYEDYIASGTEPYIGTANDGVVFIGWSTSDDYNTDSPVTTQDAEDSLSLKTSHTFTDGDDSTLKVYAVWAIDENNNGIPDYSTNDTKYTLSYSTTIGSGTTPNDSTHIAGINVTLEEASDYDDGGTMGAVDDYLVFIGWSETEYPSAFTEKPSEGTIVTEIYFNGNTTVYAVWAIDSDNDGVADYLEYTITFNQGDSGVLLDSNNTEQSSIIYDGVVDGSTLETLVPTVTATDGYTFSGWKLDGDTTNKTYSSSEAKAMTVTGDMTFTAVYSSVIIVDTSTTTGTTSNTTTSTPPSWYTLLPLFSLLLVSTTSTTLTKRLQKRH